MGYSVKKKIMQTINLRLIGLVGGAILIVGILLVGSQYVSDLTQGASADVLNYDDFPAEITISGMEYREALEKLAEYDARDDLAGKNDIVRDLSQIMADWAN